MSRPPRPTPTREGLGRFHSQAALLSGSGPQLGCHRQMWASRPFPGFVEVARMCPSTPCRPWAPTSVLPKAVREGEGTPRKKSWPCLSLPGAATEAPISHPLLKEERKGRKQAKERKEGRGERGRDGGEGETEGGG